MKSYMYIDLSLVMIIFQLATTIDRLDLLEEVKHFILQNYNVSSSNTPSSSSNDTEKPFELVTRYCENLVTAALMLSLHEVCVYVCAKASYVACTQTEFLFVPPVYM